MLPREWALPDAYNFADVVRACPLRLVLADDLTQCTTQLAYAEGRRLSGCLDLIHVPSQSLWLEWLEPTRSSALLEIPGYSGLRCPPRPNVRRSGVLIHADPLGRTGSLRTFWSTQDEQVYTAAVLTEFDLNNHVRPAFDVDSVFSGAPFGVVMPVEAALDELLSHVCFRLDPAWARYYRAAELPAAQKFLVLQEVLGNMAFDMPMILALFLLFTARDALQRRPADLGRLNVARRRCGRHPLLEHIEVRAPVAAPHPAPAPCEGSPLRRRGPRLHHVRGHIARRGDRVFWRLPHLRGSARLGVVHSRTVQLSFR